MNAWNKMCMIIRNNYMFLVFVAFSYQPLWGKQNDLHAFGEKERTKQTAWKTFINERMILKWILK